MRSDDDRAIADRLAAFFPADEVRTKPQMVKLNRALVSFYIQARTVMDRLDEVVGAEGWEDRYVVLPDGNVHCKLSVRFGDRVVTKEDVGGPSEQPDAGDRLKAAFSDALKRTAVKLGIGRYLSSIPEMWADYDPQKKRFVKPPVPPKAFLPPPEAGKGNVDRVPPVRDDQKVRIDDLVRAGKWTREQFLAACRKHTGKADLDRLSERDADHLIERMEDALSVQTA